MPAGAPEALALRMRACLLLVLLSCQPSDPPKDDPNDTSATGEADDDADGFRVVEGDCDDADPLVNPGATGDAAPYTNWSASEPYNSGDVDCAHLYDSGAWNDHPCSGLSTGYICESR